MLTNVGGCASVRLDVKPEFSLDTKPRTCEALHPHFGMKEAPKNSKVLCKVNAKRGACRCFGLAGESFWPLPS